MGLDASLRELGIYESLKYGLHILELLLTDKLDDEVRSRLVQDLPKPLKVATELSSRLTQHSINTPQGFRGGYIASGRWLDNYTCQDAELSESDLIRTLLIDPTLSDSEINAPASQVFLLDPIRHEEGDLTVLVKYIPDGGYCYSLDMRKGELKEWEHRLGTESSAEFIDSVESGGEQLPSNNLTRSASTALSNMGKVPTKSKLG